MSGWGVITWLAAIAVGPLVFLALVAHRVAGCTFDLERLNAEQLKPQRLRTQANPNDIVAETIVSGKTPTRPEAKEGRRDKKVDQPLG